MAIESLAGSANAGCPREGFTACLPKPPPSCGDPPHTRVHKQDSLLEITAASWSCERAKKSGENDKAPDYRLFGESRAGEIEVGATLASQQRKGTRISVGCHPRPGASIADQRGDVPRRPRGDRCACLVPRFCARQVRRGAARNVPAANAPRQARQRSPSKRLPRSAYLPRVSYRAEIQPESRLIQPAYIGLRPRELPT